ncbi:MAG: rod shape-determining protein MreD [candidate division Zixibacteria bacterium]|nr:rod shape-determining protein MreD [candidate division Zixibacteria bacterium]
MTWRNVGLLLLAFVVQSTIAEKLSIAGIRPDFILIAFIYISLVCGSMTGIVFGFCVGLLQDFYAPPTQLGLNALCKSVTGFLIGLGKEGLYRENFVILAIVLGVGLVMHEIPYGLIDTGFNGELFVRNFVRQSLPTIAYTLVSGMVIALLLAYREGQFHARRLFPK